MTSSQRVKEHLLLGLKGLVRRSQDSHIVHANIDTDVVVDIVPQGYDQDGLLSTRKPLEVYDIIERFALGRRKLELFGTSRNIRPGWLTVGLQLEDTSFNPQRYVSWFENVVGDPTDPCAGWEQNIPYDQPGTAADYLGYNEKNEAPVR